MLKDSLPLWDEYIRMPLGGNAEVAGLIQSVDHTADDSQAVCRTTRKRAARRLFRLWSGCVWAADGTAPKLEVGKKPRLPGLQIKIPLSVYNEISLYRPQKDEHLRWLAGVMGTCGDVSIPRAGYLLYFRIPMDGDLKERVESQLIRHQISCSCRIRGGKWEIMVRNQTKITGLLAQMGFMQTVLYLEEVAIMRQIKDRTNKQVNCDAANISKSLDAASEQMGIIRTLDSVGMTQSLPAPLRDLVEARRNNPSLSLRELGLVLPKPVSKSTVEYRWRKLASLFDDSMKFRGDRIPRHA